MKCPKCGYVGFEETTRCRHCGYDFSFAPAASVTPAPPSEHAEALDDFLGSSRLASPPPTDRLGFVDLPTFANEPSAPAEPARAAMTGLFAETTPPPARPPLAVRRGSDRPRSRPTTQVVRRSAASLLDVPLQHDASIAAAPEAASGPSPLLARAAAGVIDVALLAGIASSVVYFTVRLSGLTMAEAALVPIIPLSAFLLGLAIAYLTAFTCCGGQTLGKMAFGLRVVADDGAVPPGTAVLRALASLAGIGMAGLGVLPAIFDSERRTVHDRIAGTRVVRA